MNCEFPAKFTTDAPTRLKCPWGPRKCSWAKVALLMGGIIAAAIERKWPVVSKEVVANCPVDRSRERRRKKRRHIFKGIVADAGPERTESLGSSRGGIQTEEGRP